MKSLRRMALLAGVATSVLLVTAGAYAQSTTSSIRVRVVDASGENLSGVSVNILHVPTGRTFSRSTNSAGVLIANGLPIGGPYIVSLVDGSRAIANTVNRVEDIVLALDKSGSVMLVARRGDSADNTIEEIIVTGRALSASLQTGAGSSFSRRTIEGIPSIGRDFVSVLATDSKILVDNSVPRGPAVSIAGQNFRFNSITIDGVAQNDNFGLSFNASATQRPPISIDAIGGISVNVAPFDVEYGNFLGGNINIVTKSGTNEFHGSAYGFFTNDSLTGNRSGDIDLAIGDFKERSYGATLGGPIVKDKLFFFANYENFRTTLPANTQTIENIPGVSQAEVDRAIDIFQNVYGFDPGTFAATDVDRDEKILLKLDWNISDFHRATATYQRADGDTIFDDFPETAVLNSGRYNINERLDSYSFQLFSDWSDNFSTEFKIGYKDVKNRQISIDSSTPDFAIFTPGGGTITAGGDRFRHANTLDNTSRIVKLKGDYTTGNHTLTVGFEQEHNSVDNLFLPFSRGQVTFLSLDDLEARDPNFILIGGSNSGNPDDARGQFSLDTNTIYVQDEWLATDTLTLKFGLRLDWKNNSDAITENPNFFDRNGFSNTENLDGKSLFLPRFGFNWEANDRLTVRGGAGLFGGGTPLINLSNSYSGNGITRTFAAFFADFFGPGIEGLLNDVGQNLPNPDAVSSVFGFGVGVNPDTDVDALDPDYKLLSSWKYNLAFDYVADFSDYGLGDDWRFTAEAIYTSVKNGYDIDETRRVQIATAPDGRPIYNNTDSCSTFFNCADYVVTNTKQGHSFILSFDVAKDFDTDYGLFSTTLGYTRQRVKDVRSYNRFINFEAFAFDPQRDLNDPDLSTSKFEVPNLVTATFSWEKEIFGENLTRFSMVYSGRSGRNFSYIFNGTGAFGGNGLADFASADNAGPNLFYVPTGLNDARVTGEAGFLASLDDLINGDSCLSEFRGEIIPRNSCRTGWVNRINLRFSQEVEVSEGHLVEFTFDIENFANLLNRNWGRLDTIFQPSNIPLADVAISDDGSQFILSPSGSATASAANPNIARLPSAYRIQFGLRYKF
ncbi:MAG: hypothetical protein COB37_12280 [Kordiimonadales bacterium]|nr:MAG: hypothetical protein COB37_12280 [Kordiimonadales bacterium]